MKINKILIVITLIILLLVPYSISVDWGKLTDLGFSYAKQTGMSFVSDKSPELATLMNFYYNPSGAVIGAVESAAVKEEVINGDKLNTIKQLSGYATDPLGTLHSEIKSKIFEGLPDEVGKNVNMALQLKPWFDAVLSDGSKVKGNFGLAPEAGTTTESPSVQSHEVKGKIKNLEILDSLDEPGQDDLAKQISNEQIIKDFKSFHSKYGIEGDGAWSIDKDEKGPYKLKASKETQLTIKKPDGKTESILHVKEGTEITYGYLSEKSKEPIILQAEIIPKNVSSKFNLFGQEIELNSEQITDNTRIIATYNGKTYDVKLEGLAGLTVENDDIEFLETPESFKLGKENVELKGKVKVKLDGMDKEVTVDGTLIKDANGWRMLEGTKISNKESAKQLNYIEITAKSDTKLTIDSNPSGYKFTSKNELVLSKDAQKFNRKGGIDLEVGFNDEEDIKSGNFDTKVLYLPALEGEATTYFSFNPQYGEDYFLNFDKVDKTKDQILLRGEQIRYDQEDGRVKLIYGKDSKIEIKDGNIKTKYRPRLDKVFGDLNGRLQVNLKDESGKEELYQAKTGDGKIKFKKISVKNNVNLNSNLNKLQEIRSKVPESPKPTEEEKVTLTEKDPRFSSPTSISEGEYTIDRVKTDSKGNEIVFLKNDKGESAGVVTREYLNRIADIQAGNLMDIKSSEVVDDVEGRLRIKAMGLEDGKTDLSIEEINKWLKNDDKLNEWLKNEENLKGAKELMENTVFSYDLDDEESIAVLRKIQDNNLVNSVYGTGGIESLKSFEPIIEQRNAVEKVQTTLKNEVFDENDNQGILKLLEHQDYKEGSKFYKVDGIWYLESSDGVTTRAINKKGTINPLAMELETKLAEIKPSSDVASTTNLGSVTLPGDTTTTPTSEPNTPTQQQIGSVTPIETQIESFIESNKIIVIEPQGGFDKSKYSKTYNYPLRDISDKKDKGSVEIIKNGKFLRQSIVKDPITKIEYEYGYELALTRKQYPDNRARIIRIKEPGTKDFRRLNEEDINKIPGYIKESISKFSERDRTFWEAMRPVPGIYDNYQNAFNVFL